MKHTLYKRLIRPVQFWLCQRSGYRAFVPRFDEDEL